MAKNYELYGVISHKGDTTSSGHYSSFIKGYNKIDSKTYLFYDLIINKFILSSNGMWHKSDDEIVKFTNLDQVL